MKFKIVFISLLLSSLMRTSYADNWPTSQPSIVPTQFDNSEDTYDIVLSSTGSIAVDLSDYIGEFKGGVAVSWWRALWELSVCRKRT